MTANLSPHKPQLDDATKNFIRRGLSSKLLEIDDIKKVVASLLAQKQQLTPKVLSDGLVGADLITKWQAKNLLEGKNRGFHLGSYRLLRPLGKGGMGIVFLGEHEVMKRLMALKVLPSKALDDERRIERFKEEARASGQLDHPNIVRAHDFAHDNEKFYIVMEYVDGIDLQQAVARDGTMAYADALDAIIQVTTGLSHAHERGVIHRDIKPSNMLLRNDGVVKVSDLGLARMSFGSGEGQGNRLMGTADFVAPEQALNAQSVDARADIYSLGCSFYFLLTGRTPFGGGTTQERLAKHQTAPPPDVRSVRADCPAAIAELIQRMMAKRPDDRPKSCVELLGQLKRVAGRTGSSALQDRNSYADTVTEDPLMQVTIDDSSFPSSDGSNPLSLDQLDFGSLPPVDFAASPTAAPTAPTTFPGTTTTPQPKAVTQKTGKNKSKKSGDNQQLLLGIGLSVAIMALLFTVGIMIYTITKPDERISPKIKSMEDGKNGRIIVVGD